MNVKEQLHAIVDRLDTDRAEDALTYLRRLSGEEQMTNDACDRLTRRMQPSTVSGHVFFSDVSKDLAQIAAEQGVRPIASFDVLLGNVWPDNETPDAFIAAVREWRRVG